MSNKHKYVSCSYCSEENAENATICSKCGRIIQARQKAPFDYRPIAALVLVVVAAIIAAIATIVGTTESVKNHWSEYWYEFHYWYLNNEEAVSAILCIILVITTTFIVCKFSKAKTFGSIYVISYIIMFILGLIIESFDCWMTDASFSDFFSIIYAILILSLAPSVFVKIIRSVNS